MPHSARRSMGADPVAATLGNAQWRCERIGRCHGRLPCDHAWENVDCRCRRRSDELQYHTRAKHLKNR